MVEKFVVKIAGEGFEFTMQAEGEKAAVLGAAKGLFPQKDVSLVSFGSVEENKKELLEGN